MSKRKHWDYALDGDPVDKIDAQRDVIVELNVKLDRANDEIASLKNLLAECVMTIDRFRYLAICNDCDKPAVPPYDGSEADTAGKLLQRCREAQK